MFTVGVTVCCICWGQAELAKAHAEAEGLKVRDWLEPSSSVSGLELRQPARCPCHAGGSRQGQSGAGEGRGALC